MQAWLQEVTDVGFTDMRCNPHELSRTGERLKTCEYTDKLITVEPEPEEADLYKNKLSVDLDGDVPSSRWLNLLRGGTMPIKATMLVEWHDDRLQPWVHYVPMDNTFIDIYGLLDYFIRPKANDDVDYNYDKAAETIATSGAEWSKNWLRRIDMQLYTWRLLLEYARVMDDQRDRLGYVDDEIDRAKKHYEQ
jgi:hypothetical protein